MVRALWQNLHGRSQTIQYAIVRNETLVVHTKKRKSNIPGFKFVVFYLRLKVAFEAKLWGAFNFVLKEKYKSLPKPLFICTQQATISLIFWAFAQIIIQTSKSFVDCALKTVEEYQFASWKNLKGKYKYRKQYLESLLKQPIFSSKWKKKN